MSVKNFVNNRRRRKPRTKKIKMTITIDEELYIASGDYIDNMSAFFNNSLKRYIKKCEEEEEKLRIMSIKSRADSANMTINEFVANEIAFAKYDKYFRKGQ